MSPGPGEAEIVRRTKGTSGTEGTRRIIIYGSPDGRGKQYCSDFRIMGITRERPSFVATTVVAPNKLSSLSVVAGLEGRGYGEEQLLLKVPGPCTTHAFAELATASGGDLGVAQQQRLLSMRSFRKGNWVGRKSAALLAGSKI